MMSASVQDIALQVQEYGYKVSIWGDICKNAKKEPNATCMSIVGKLSKEDKFDRLYIIWSHELFMDILFRLRLSKYNENGYKYVDSSYRFARDGWRL